MSLSTLQTRQCVRFYCCVLVFLSTMLLWRFYVSNANATMCSFCISVNNAFTVIWCRCKQCKLYLGLHVICPIFCPILPKFGLCRQIFIVCPIFLSDFTQIWIISMDFHNLPDIFVWFYPNLDYLDGFSQESPMRKFTKILPFGTELIHADGQDLTEPIGAFRWRTRTRVN
jgi:hypothetical protein